MTDNGNGNGGLSDRDHPQGTPDDSKYTPEEIHEMVIRALEAAGVELPDSDIFVGRVSPEQLTGVLAALQHGSVPRLNWIPEFFSGMVAENAHVGLMARSNGLELDEILHSPDEIEEFTETMPLLTVEDHDAWLVWKQTALEVIRVVDAAVERHGFKQD